MSSATALCCRAPTNEISLEVTSDHRSLPDTFLNRPHSSSTLTNRVRVVVQLIAEGHSSKQIPSVLKINLKTVERCRAAIMRKLELSSPAATVRYAIRNRLVEA